MLGLAILQVVQLGAAEVEEEGQVHLAHGGQLVGHDAAQAVDVALGLGLAAAARGPR